MRNERHERGPEWMKTFFLGSVLVVGGCATRTTSGAADPGTGGGLNGGDAPPAPSPLPDASLPPVSRDAGADGSKGDSCTSDTDCAQGDSGAGRVCATTGAEAIGECIPGCHGDSDCPAGYRCDETASPHWQCAPADAGPSGCGQFAGDTTPTCSEDGSSLGTCTNGKADVQACTQGCLRATAPEPSSCLLAQATNFTCTGSYATVPVNDGNYYLTSFGCYIDTNGTVQTDPGDNCIPTCLSQAQASGLCPAGSTGPACEEKTTWYVADGARFGCLARLLITNPANGKRVVAVALDYGPACSVENGVSHAVLDASGRIDDYLFGGSEGSTDKALVHVVQVDGTTPLGPQ